MAASNVTLDLRPIASTAATTLAAAQPRVGRDAIVPAPCLTGAPTSSVRPQPRNPRADTVLTNLGSAPQWSIGPKCERSPSPPGVTHRA